jgi:glycosyltransferase involved in cell wall biosynthesis
MTTHVCFVCCGAYPLFSPADRGPIGGTELRSWLFATRLSEDPLFQVSFLVDDTGQSSTQRFGDVQVQAVTFLHDWIGDRVIRHLMRSMEPRPGLLGMPFRVKHWHAGLLWQLPLGGFFTPFSRLRRRLGWSAKHYRSPLLVQRNPADIYCCFGVNGVSACMTTFCQRQGLRSILFLASDTDLAERYRPGSNSLNTYGDRVADCYDTLQQAEVIVAQTARQQTLLRVRFGREAILIRNPYDFGSRLVEGEPKGEPFVLWVGRSDPFKRPGLYLDLARACPEVPFVMVLNVASPELHKALLRSVPANVRVIDRLPFAEMERVFHQAAVLVNTSETEGSPNTFLQAARHGVAVITCGIDPDGLLAQHDAGIVAQGGTEQLAALLRELWTDPERRRRLAARLRACLEPLHAIDGRVAELAALLGSLRARSASRSERGEACVG